MIQNFREAIIFAQKFQSELKANGCESWMTGRQIESMPTLAIAGSTSAPLAFDDTELCTHFRVFLLMRAKSTEQMPDKARYGREYALHTPLK
jgi:hypothetical protein